MNYNPLITALALSRLPRFGPIKFQELIAELTRSHAQSSPLNLLEKLPQEFSRVFQNYQQTFTDIYRQGEKLYQELIHRNIGLVCIGEQNYPRMLEQLPDPPIVLFYCGDISLANTSDSLSIVGTRKLTDYGIYNTKELINSIFQFHPTIISGMAFGVDALAHELAISSGLNTIAVLPTAADVAYPPSHEHLYQKIISSGGLVLSETAPGEEFHKGFLPRRNRVIAGLAKATIVIEAGIPSGATITAEMAFDYGREVFCFPGSVQQPTMAGCNALIKQNKAQLIQSGDDISHLFSKPANTINKYNPNNLAGLTETERLIYQFLFPEPKHVEEICVKFDISIQNTLSLLVGLEMKDLIIKTNDLKYLAIK